jgi:hypothetical protein
VVHIETAYRRMPREFTDWSKAWRIAAALSPLCDNHQSHYGALYGSRDRTASVRSPGNPSLASASAPGCSSSCRFKEPRRHGRNRKAKMTPAATMASEVRPKMRTLIDSIIECLLYQAK